MGKSMDNKLKILRRFMAYMCINSLLFYSTTAFSQSGLMGGISQGLNAASKYVQQSGQMQQFQQQMYGKMQQLQPTNVPAKYFPQCQMPQLQSNFDTNMCAAPIQMPQQQQMYSMIQTGQNDGMQTLDQCLEGLVRDRQVSPSDARTYAVDKSKFM